MPKAWIGAIVALALLLPAAGPAAERQVTGQVTQNGLTLTLVDGFALRSHRGDSVTVYLYPVEIAERDIRTARAGQPWAVALRKPSPDPRRWDWCPTVEIDLEAVNGRLNGRGDLTFVNFMFSGLQKRNHTTNLTRSGDQARASVTALSFETVDGRPFVKLRSRATGLSYDGNNEYSWRLQARLPVYDAPAPTRPEGR